ncbi:MAG: hypothetical protein COA32_06380 [Fluviicola sp.]|nr:MAG: hypothetical protein COA32_06380 [Fluviicola sp.]
MTQIKYVAIAMISLLLIVSCGVQKESNTPFEGKLVYSVSSVENNPNDADSINYQVVYAKDSLLRIESFTPIGKQIYIKHIPKERAYILMDLYEKKVAIQTITDTIDRSDKYSFKSKMGSKTFAGKKAKNIAVTFNELDTTIVMNYIEDISPQYTEAIEGIPGLPVKYSVYSKGLWITYELISFEEREISKDKFGIPSDHEIMTLDEFMKIMQN